jgi:hypothetical protein
MSETSLRFRSRLRSPLLGVNRAKNEQMRLFFPGAPVAVPESPTRAAGRAGIHARRRAVVLHCTFKGKVSGSLFNLWVPIIKVESEDSAHGPGPAAKPEPGAPAARWENAQSLEAATVRVTVSGCSRSR